MHKFSRKTIPFVFLGYSALHKGYRCLNPNTYRVNISQYVVFNENYFLYLSRKKSKPITSSDF